MTKRQMFKYLRIRGFKLKQIAVNINICERTAKRWNVEYKNNELIRTHRFKGKKSNFTSKINRNEILANYLASTSKITRDQKAEPYNFAYYVEHKMKTSAHYQLLKILCEKTW